MTIRKTRNEIINRALSLIGAAPAGEAPLNEDYLIALDALNDIVRQWQSQGAHLWSRNSATLFLQPGQIKYQFGRGTDNATEEYQTTTLSADAVQGVTTLSFTDSVTVLEGDNVGVRLDDGTIFWTTAKRVKPSLLLTDAVPSLASSGKRVFVYTARIGKTLRIPDMRRQEGSIPNTSEIEMFQLGRQDYLNLPNKLTTGTPVQFYHDPKREFSELFIWPAPTTTDELLNFTYYKPLDVFDDAEDSADFPDEWVLALKYNLAANISPDIMARDPSPALERRAFQYLQDAMDWDQGDASVYFQYGMKGD